MDWTAAPRRWNTLAYNY